MLIRSQNKKALYNMNTNKGLYVTVRNKGFEVVAEGFGDMGTYPTEEIATKVLDFIIDDFKHDCKTFDMP